jgi:DNA-binding transcriptional LysR family regulator
MPKTLCSPPTLEGLVALPFEEPVTRDLHLIYPHDRPLSAAARALISYIRTHIPKHELVERR